MERTLFRRNPSTSQLRSYVLSMAECDGLTAAGLDSETTGEDELTRRAERWNDHDDQNRIISTVTAKPPETVVVKYPRSH